MDTMPRWKRVLILTLGELVLALIALPLYIFLVLPRHAEGGLPGFIPVIAEGVNPALAVLATLGVLVAALGLVIVLARFVDPRKLLTDEVVELVEGSAIADFVPIYLAAGFAEEFLFRVVALDLCGLVISSLLFTAMHLNYWKKPLVLADVFVVALLMGALYLFTGSLLLCAIAHAAYNLLLSVFLKRGILLPKISEL